MSLPPPQPQGYPQPQPLAYEWQSWQSARDAAHLRILAICHYIYGGIIAAVSSIFIIHVVMGVMMLRNPSFFPVPTTGPAGAPPPAGFFGYTFLCMGSGAVLLGWTLGILNILSGRFLARRRRRVFSLIVAGIDCVNVPLGTALGVFTFLVLLRDSVKAAYDAGSSAAPMQ